MDNNVMAIIMTTDGHDDYNTIELHVLYYIARGGQVYTCTFLHSTTLRSPGTKISINVCNTYTIHIDEQH